MFTTRNLNHLAPPVFSLGPETGFAEGFEAAYTRQTEVESAYSFQIRLRDEYVRNIARAQELGGVFPGLERGRYSQGLPSLIELGLKRENGSDPYALNPLPGLVESYLKQLDDNDLKLSELQKLDPTLKTFKQLVAEEWARRKEIIARTDDIAGRAGLGGLLGGLAGGIVGSFNIEREPSAFIGLMLGGWGRSLLTRVITEMGVAAGIEGINQLAYVRPMHQIGGEESGEFFASILYAALGTGVLRGAVEVTPGTYRALERVVSPDRAAARLIGETIEEQIGRPLDYSLIRQPLTDAQLRAAVKQLNAKPSLEELALDAARELTEAASPYPATRAGAVLTEKELAETLARIEGTPPAVPARFEEPLEVALTMEGGAKAAFGARVDPELYREMELAKAKITTADARLEEIESVLSGRTPADVVSLVDKEAGSRLKEIEAKMDTRLPPAERAALRNEADQIVSRFKPEELQEAEKAWRAPLLREREVLRAQTTGARQDLVPLVRAARTVEAQYRVGEPEAVTASATGRQEAVEAAKAADEFDLEKTTEVVTELVNRSVGKVEAEPSTKPVKPKLVTKEIPDFSLIRNPLALQKEVGLKEADALVAAGRAGTGIYASVMGALAREKTPARLKTARARLVWWIEQLDKTAQEKAMVEFFGLNATPNEKYPGGFKAKVAEAKRLLAEAKKAGEGKETLTAKVPDQTEPTSVDLGLQEEVDLDLEVPLPNGEVTTVRAVIADLQDDDAALKAAKECSLL